LDRLIHSLSATSSAVARWSLYATESRQCSLGVKDREAGNSHAPLSLAESSAARYLFVWKDGRISRGFLERRQLDGDPAETIASAWATAYDDPDAAQVLGPAEFPAVQLHDPETAAAARGDTGWLRGRLAQIRSVLAEPACRTWSGSFSAGETHARLATSEGLDVSGEGTSVGWHVTVDGEVGDGVRGRALDDDKAFDARLERVLELARKLREPADSAPEGITPVILHPAIVQEYALSTLLHHLDGSTIAHGEGLFKPEQIGSDEALLREDLTLRVDPLEPLKVGSYRFSPDGLPAARCTYIDSGRLVEPVLNLKYARRLERQPTPIPYAMDVLHLEGPERLPLAEAISRADGGALVLSVLGVHTQDSSSGDFSLSAPQVLQLRDGQLRGRLRATISGNLFDVLRSDALQLVAFEGETTPGLLFPCRLDSK
jgi:PmbA protein